MVKIVEIAFGPAARLKGVGEAQDRTTIQNA